MMGIEYRDLQCPYCGEFIQISVDSSAGEHSCVEDCQVCCRPIEIRLLHDGDAWQLEAHRDDD